MEIGTVALEIMMRRKRVYADGKTWSQNFENCFNLTIIEA